MKTEIELENGDCVEMDFSWDVHESGEYEYDLDYYTPYDENTGEPLLPVNATSMEITDDIAAQLEKAVTKEIEEMEFDTADI